MKVGLLGFTSSGKSTLYRAAARGQAKGSVTAVPVPDERYDKIVAQVNPKKATPATVIFHDDLGSIIGDSPKKFPQLLIDQARKMELLLHVVRAFDTPSAPYYTDIDPIRDQKTVEEELIVIDLQIVENRLDRLKRSNTSKNPGSQDYLDKVLFEKLIEPLSNGIPLRKIELSEDEQTVLRNYQFLSAKPLVVAFNVGEHDMNPIPSYLKDYIEKLSSEGIMAFCVTATIEEEISQLDPQDQKEFLESLGLHEPASARIIRSIYDALGLITFFTAGEGETRAWPLAKGSTSLKAADTIHSDIARGFIRAEVVHYEDWLTTGSLDAAYSNHKMRLEGKEYIVKDGDLLHIRNKT